MAKDKDWDVDSLISATDHDALISITFADGDGNFTVPCSLLFNASIWFRRALAPGRFGEGESKLIKLSEANPCMFRHFVFWLYNKRLPQYDLPDASGALDAYVKVIVQLWIYGDAYFLQSLQNEAMHKLIAMIRVNWPSIDTLKEAFSRAPDTKLSDLLLWVLLANMRRHTQLAGVGRYSIDDLEALGTLQGFNKALYGRLISADGTHFVSKRRDIVPKVEDFLVKERTSRT